jgi:DNA-dependent RNA polymerase auxiliary subunit epsilon
MIFKVFYQKDKSRSPRRETTEILYLDLNVEDARAGVIAARELLTANTAYHVEFIDALSDESVEYEKETGVFEITTF